MSPLAHPEEYRGPIAFLCNTAPPGTAHRMQHHIVCNTPTTCNNSPLDNHQGTQKLPTGFLKGFPLRLLVLPSTFAKQVFDLSTLCMRNVDLPYIPLINPKWLEKVYSKVYRRFHPVLLNYFFLFKHSLH